ncbi:MAG: serine protease [Proteobacteria bacterium]|nr:serine protease [Pseudomonadota bacterium]
MFKDFPNTILLFTVALLHSALGTTAWAQDAKSLFSEYGNRIYQIRIIDRNSGKQAGLGSGFLVDADGHVVTNYHVVSAYTHHPDRFDIEFVSHAGDKGALALVNLDVINDLALLQLNDPPDYFIELADQLPEHGEAIYSIGNPHDLGWTVIPGTYNGIAAHSVYERIHFSGSVNPGMSGGPVLNNKGEVIGVNVATAGNQLSFLVPLNRLTAFIGRSETSTFDIAMGDQTVADQLRKNQRSMINKLLEDSWDTAELGHAVVPSEISPQVRCWGYSEDDPEILYSHSATTCGSEEQIYLSSEFTTGNVAYQFNWLDSKELNSIRFYNMYAEKFAKAYADNEAGKEDVTEFACHEDFIRSDSLSGRDVVTKTTFCVREYKKYRGLFDVLFFGASVHERTAGLISHFTIAGIERELAMAFMRKFISSIQWN